mgnify:CR=1 FL=1
MVIRAAWGAARVPFAGIAAFALVASIPARADYRADVGYTALETELGVRLFDRHRDGYQLTDAGAQMVPGANPLSEVEAVVSAAKERWGLEGGIIDGLSQLFNSKITFRNGVIDQRNFHQYPLLRLPQAPEIEVAFLEPAQFPPTGAGEPSLPPSRTTLISPRPPRRSRRSSGAWPARRRA